MRGVSMTYLTDIGGGLHTDFLYVGSDEVGVVHVDEVELHGDQLADQVDGLLRLRVHHGLHAVLQTLLEERAGVEEGDGDLLDGEAQLVLHQLRALLTTLKAETSAYQYG